MTEQDLRAKISQCDGQIASSYRDFVSAAKNLGAEAYIAARNVRSSAESSASGKVAFGILVPLGIAVVGFIILKDTGLLRFLVAIGGIALSIHLGKKYSQEKERICNSMKQMEDQVRQQQAWLYQVIEDNQNI